MSKQAIESIKQKNLTIAAILGALDTRKSFLIVGHTNPDEDCIASMVAFGLLVTKFNKTAQIRLGTRMHDHYNYLLTICTYNAIRVVYGDEPVNPGVDAVVVCDTPKPSMMEITPDIKKLMGVEQTVVIEVDHHLQADSEYIGDPGYCLVTEASSAAELIGHVVLKLRYDEDLLGRYGIADPLSRNLVLAILTGIIGDSKMGQFLKSRREERYYRIFSNIFNEYLTEQTTKTTNIANMDEVFREIQKLSESEEKCYRYFKSRTRRTGSMGIAVLGPEDAEHLYTAYDRDVVVSVARTMADELAEESGKLSLVAYVDDPASSDLIQFRMRRSKGYRALDLRTLLPILHIENGGGHEGAIGFRIPRREIRDLNAFVKTIVETVELHA